MAYLDQIPSATRERLLTLECPTFAIPDWSPIENLSERQVALISSAGIHHRNDAPFRGGDAHYAAISDDTPDADIVMSHVSVNFDRTGFQADLDVILPRRALHKLASDGVIGRVGPTHYAFMGATDPREMESGARELGARLKAEGTDTVVLVPV